MAPAASDDEANLEEDNEDEGRYLDPTGEVDFIFQREGTSVFVDVTVLSHGLGFAQATAAGMSRFSFESTCAQKEKLKERKYQQGLSAWSVSRQQPAVLETFVFNGFGRSNRKVDALLEACAASKASRLNLPSISTGQILYDYQKELALKVSKVHARSYAHKLGILRALNQGVRILFEDDQLVGRLHLPPVVL